MSYMFCACVFFFFSLTTLHGWSQVPLHCGEYLYSQHKNKGTTVYTLHIITLYHFRYTLLPRACSGPHVLPPFAMRRRRIFGHSLDCETCNILNFLYFPIYLLFYTFFRRHAIVFLCNYLCCLLLGLSLFAGLLWPTCGRLATVLWK